MPGALEQSQTGAYNRYVVIIAIAVSILLTLYVNVYLGINVVYTHFYYIPIILTGIWYHRKAIYLALFLGAAHVLIGFALTGALVPDTLVRAGMFLLVAAVVAYLAESKDRLFNAVKVSENNLSTVFNSVYDGIFIHDAEGRVIDVNARMLEMYRVPRGEAKKLTIADYSSPANPLDRLPAIWDKVMAGEDQLFEWIARRPSDGTTFHAEVFLKRIVLSGKPSIMATVRDIDRRVRAEKEVEDARRQAELYVDLMGHDINNMNQIGIGYLEEALAELKLTAEDRVLLTKPLEALYNSSRLIDNVRKLQVVQEGHLKLEPVDVGRTIEDVIPRFLHVPGREAIINYRAPGGCQTMANALLKDVFYNIIDNAIKHSEGPVTIDIALDGVAINEKKYCRVTVDDNGPGVPDDLKGKIFTRFERGKTRASGKGLGLYLVRSLVESYHGRVWVEDRVPGDYAKGARFVVELPAID